MQDHLPPQTTAGALLNDIRRMIEKTRSSVAIAVNTGLTLLHWRIGRRINDEILKGDRAEYGKQILATLSQELTAEYDEDFLLKSFSILLVPWEPFLMHRLSLHCRDN